MTSIQELVDRIEGELRGLGDPERRRVMEGYAPSELEPLGVTVPDARQTMRRVRAELKDEPPGRIVDLALALARAGTFEGRGVGYELLGRRRDALETLDRSTVERLGEGMDNWGTVDGFSVTVSGPAWRLGRLDDGDVLAWAGSPDRWWRRAALVSTVPLNKKSRGGSGDPGRTLAVCEALAGDREPMVAKALSWALRELVAHDREGVEGFLDRHGEAVPALVRREVRNKLRTGRKSG
ncbi:MAG: DNA alkylation repair protein [Gemmatimonadota bacterium]|jgi:3-methyladenine DNA glycosylase AlkD